MNIKRITSAIAAGFLVAMAVPALASAATNTVTVTGSGQSGWTINPDLANATPYEFTEEESKIGDGSLRALPIGSTAAHKFIAEKTLGTPVTALDTLSFDFQIDDASLVTAANQVYMNVYANFGDSLPTKYYDCRYDVVATVASTGAFTTVSFDPTQAYPVVTRSGASPSPRTCPAIPADMQTLSPTGTAVFRAFSLNAGDTSTTDVGLSVNFDNAIVSLNNGDVTIYDFEQAPTRLTSKEACKEGGWKTSEAPVYKNQGDCVSSFASKKKAAESTSLFTQFREALSL